MNDLLRTDAGTNSEDELLPVALGDIAELTEGQGRGQSEDKRRAYNS
ncbi:albusnodin family lasso peptide [Streptomyces corynorhini]|uniref:Albusnodin family lasso peptide n=1 Tax=Streptomyces corynorhini TaxID=2282652 RepID=A0A370B2W4_9ACTN|nr:albusnodin family lasso peptide [Streptomyces corynorhini]RDG35931.1 albusnodin family lasso peptide [Streptomyces corynorhini]